MGLHVDVVAEAVVEAEVEGRLAVKRAIAIKTRVGVRGIFCFQRELISHLVSNATKEGGISAKPFGALNLTGSSVATVTDANLANGLISSAVDTINNSRSNIGASQNRLDFASSNIATAAENAEASRSQLMDLDVAAEMSFFTSRQILVQAGVSMLAQANQQPQTLLTLFQN